MDETQTATIVVAGVSTASEILAKYMAPDSHFHQIAELFPGMATLGLDAFRAYDSNATDTAKAETIANDAAIASQAIAATLTPKSPIFTFASLFPGLAAVGLDAFRKTQTP